ncbi:MAG TPA: N-carbamoylputrescine amidase [Steroidobacteraceae bacterium]|nr:N-carbamoylputrescine amidase [Steroidobacteraceae bacterium]
MITVAATQFACTEDRAANLRRAEQQVRNAHERGAQVILLQELFETPYFCKDHDVKHFDLALSIADNPAIQRMRQLADELNVVLPVSVFERAGNAFFNSVAVIDAGGVLLGVYRKAHIPESPGYHEKFFFSPGDTGFRVWHTKYGVIGVGICWDQWFPECARIMALKGAELLLYPTAIGEEPQDKSIDSQPHWQRTMQGHAAANIMPVIASNRIGVEKGARWQVQYYGSSFITDHTGAIVEQCDRVSEAVITASFDIDAIRRYRESWGVFRDRRVDLYKPLLTFDGEAEVS